MAKPGYDSQGNAPCDEGRGKLLLQADPGCGKSAIAATVTKRCKNEKVLLAQLFINHSNKETTDPNTFFPMIARQLANRSSGVLHATYNQLKVVPSPADGVSSKQASGLFVNALAVASTLHHDHIVAVIIDGLKETKPECLYDSEHIFTALCLYPNVKVCRTEGDILILPLLSVMLHYF